MIKIMTSEKYEKNINEAIKQGKLEMFELIHNLFSNKKKIYLGPLNINASGHFVQNCLFLSKDYQYAIWINPKKPGKLHNNKIINPELLSKVKTSENLLAELEDENGNHKDEISPISTIHRIQGGERKVIIFSAVRSNRKGNIGFFASKDGPAFITVAITRPKEKLVVLLEI